MGQITDTGLVRGIRRWDLVALVINGIIGAGIFGLPSRVYGLIGTYSLLAFLACALVIILIVLCFAEVSSRFTETGGPYLYAREVFGSVIGFEIGWLMWLRYLTSFAAICNLLVLYLGYFWPGASSGLWRALIIAGVVIALMIINLIGVRQSAIVGDIFTIGKLIPILLFVVVGLLFINPQQYSIVAQANSSSFSAAVLLLVYAFTGFETPIITAGEVTEPRRNLPFALLTGIGVVALLYVLIQFVCIGTLPELANSERPLADASRRFMGRAGASIISVGALVSMIGTLNATMLAGSRLPFAMAEQGQLPRIFKATHRRFHTPYIPILLSSTVILVLTVSGTFIYALTISTIIRLLSYAATCAALPTLRRKSDERAAAFEVPGGVIVSIAALALIVWLLSNSGWREARDVGVAGALGLLLYIGYDLRRRKPLPRG